MNNLEEWFSSALHNTSRAWRPAAPQILGCQSSQLDDDCGRSTGSLPLSQSELAERQAVEGATMVSLVDRLLLAIPWFYVEFVW